MVVDKSETRCCTLLLHPVTSTSINRHSGHWHRRLPQEVHQEGGCGHHSHQPKCEPVISSIRWYFTTSASFFFDRLLRWSVIPSTSTWLRFQPFWRSLPRIIPTTPTRTRFCAGPRACSVPTRVFLFVCLHSFVFDYFVPSQNYKLCHPLMRDWILNASRHFCCGESPEMFSQLRPGPP